MTKVEIASYLVSLHTLLEAQSKGQTSVPSRTLAQEYEKHWTMLKEAIAKDNDNEARQKYQEPKRIEDRTQINRY